jgi:hypothetical protein
MKTMWYPPASKFQLFAPNARMGRVEKLILHTTETQGWPGYGSNHPTITYNPWLHQWRQHMPIDGTATALVDSSNTAVRENRDCAQLEIVAYCDLAMGRKYGHAVTDMDDAALRDVAEFIVWLHREWGMSTDFINDWKPYPVSYGLRNGVRLSGPQFDAFRGVLGHQHVSGNEHGDPGTLDVGRIRRYVQEILAPAPTVAPVAPTPPPPDPEELPFMAATKSDYYASTSVPQALKEGANDLKIKPAVTENGTERNFYTITSESPAVDLTVTVRHAGLEVGQRAEAYAVWYDDGKERVVRYKRKPVSLRGSGADVEVGDELRIAGAVPVSKTKGNKTLLRVRVDVPKGHKMTVHSVEISGWVLPK